MEVDVQVSRRYQLFVIMSAGGCLEPDPLDDAKIKDILSKWIALGRLTNKEWRHVGKVTANLVMTYPEMFNPRAVTK